MTDVFLSASGHETDPQDLWSYLVLEEAIDVVAAASMMTLCGIVDQPAQVVAKCFSYMLDLCCTGPHRIDYDLATHGSNYWICDGIMQHQQHGTDADDGLWRAADALKHEMRHHHENQYLPPLLSMRPERKPYWSSPLYLLVQARFIPNGDMFQYFNKLCVLKLSHCTFSFSSPPFIFCYGLRFLCLDHCQDNKIIGTDAAAHKEEEEEHIRQCFQRLWVLDVRYTCSDHILSARMMDLMTQLRELNVMGVEDWDMGQSEGRLPNIRKLRVTKSTIRCSSCSENDLFSKRNKLELLEFSGNSTIFPMTSLSVGPGIISSNSSSLETVIIDGRIGVKEITLKGCAKLKNLLLRGLFQDLYSLDVSDTAVKTLDLSSTTAMNLNKLYLFGCDKLCAILWPEDKREKYMNKLCIDTTQSASTSLSVLHGGRAPSKFDCCILVRDVRLLVSLEPVKTYFNSHDQAHVEVSSPTHPAVDVCDNISKDGGIIKSHIGSKQQMPIRLLQQQKEGNSMYEDVAVSFKDHVLQPKEGGVDAPTITQIWDCPHIPDTSSSNCYLHIQDKTMTKLQMGGEETTTSITIPDFISNNSWILHVHDSLFITTIPGPTPSIGSSWKKLHWCRVERCPELDCVFTPPRVEEGNRDCLVFWFLETFWASQLPKARFIWNWGRPSSVFQLQEWSFDELNLLHVDLCPRLIHVLPLPWRMVYHSLRYLVTLKIVWCGDLREVFPLHTDDAESHQQRVEQSITVEFQRLKHIHLHELPKLQGICGRWKMSAPMLETVKIRGCWSLTRLPAVGNDRSRKVKCDCEKEWWDRLEWDGLEANHQPSIYNPTHSRYYKKTTLLTGSLLR